MSEFDPYIAANRFGFGARPGEIETIARDPKAWLRDQIKPTSSPTGPGTIFPDDTKFADLPPAHLLAKEWYEVRRSREMRRRFRRERARPVYRSEVMRRIEVAAVSDTPFRERLIHFWSNHFTVSVAAGRITGMVGAFEREAIRPNVAEKFVDMLMAVVKHPTMQLYLDNVASVGPHSEFGLRRNKGLNENLAREIMELHTLGVDGGYNQDDVREFAKILTGWSVANLRYLSPGRFAFDRARHEPGDKRLLGKTYDRESVEDGEAALRALAAHPSTARFIATKLARHFVADDPPQSAIRRLQHVFQQTGGDLGAVSKALVDLPEVWRTPLPKVKSPNELIISALRLIGRPDRAKGVMRTLRLLGQRTFSAPSPAGWPDIAENWLHPEAMIRRIVFLSDLARIYGRGRDPEALMDAVAGPMASNETAQTVRRAASAAEAVALLMISPEFQRR